MIKPIKLRCREAYTRDVGRGHIRIDYDVMDKLKISTGDIVEIEGKKKTVAKALPLYPSDEGKEMARADGIIRQNMGIIVDDEIKITKAKATPGVVITVKSMEALPPIDERYLADAFEGTPMSMNDYFLVPYFGGRLRFQVVKTDPKGALVVTRSTVFVIEDVKNDKDKVTCPTCGSLV